MLKNYESPEFEIKKFTLSNSILTVSQGEQGATGGGSIDPGEEEEEP